MFKLVAWLLALVCGLFRFFYAGLRLVGWFWRWFVSWLIGCLALVFELVSWFLALICGLVSWFLAEFLGWLVGCFALVF